MQLFPTKSRELGRMCVIPLRACLKIGRGAVFEARPGWQGATRENILHEYSTEEQRGQPALASIILRAAGHFVLGFVGARVTPRCGDAPHSPPRPKPNSRAAAPLPIFRQALTSADESSRASWESKQDIGWCEKTACILSGRTRNTRQNGCCTAWS